MNRPSLPAAICIGTALLFAGDAGAEEVSREFSLGLDAFVKLTDQARLYFNAARNNERESTAHETEVGANVDLTLMPIVRRRLREEDWARERYIFVRAGYRVFEDDAGRTERRPIVELHSRAEPVDTWWLFSRLRYEHRDIEGAQSWRFRVRLGMEKESAWGGHDVVPYVHAEAFYDSRFDAWSRERYEAGAEIKLNKNWRIEPYLARQRDDRPSPARLDTLGVNIKYFH